MKTTVLSKSSFFSKWFQSTRKRKREAGFFKFLRFKGRFRKSPFFDGLLWTEGFTGEVMLRFQTPSGFSVDAVLHFVPCSTHKQVSWPLINVKRSAFKLNLFINWLSNDSPYRYEIFLDEVKPESLSLSFLREFMDLPISYFAAGAPLKYRKLYTWGQFRNQDGNWSEHWEVGAWYFVHVQWNPIKALTNAPQKSGRINEVA